MKHKQFGKKYIIKLEKGEEIAECLKNFCRENRIFLGTLYGIGAANRVKIGLFKTGNKEYISKDYEGDFEIISLLGNISTMNGEIYLHAHINISDEKNRCFGGHLNSAIISATFEGIVEKIEGTMEREFEENIGLNLYKL